MRRTTLLLSVTVAIVFSIGGVALAVGGLDQQQTTVSSAIGMDATYPMAQTFTAGSSGSLDAVSMHAARVGTTDAGDMLLSIQSLDEAGRPSGTVLGSGVAPIEDFNASPPNTWVDVDLAQPATVRAGEGYALVATTENTTPTGSSFYSWSMAFNDPYPGGDAHDRNEGAWNVRTDNGVPLDFAFKTFVTPDTAAPRVASVTPQNGASDVGRDANVTATFTERMDPASITGSTFKLYRINPDRSASRINAAVTLLETPSPGGLKAELDPFGSTTKALKPGARYKAVVTTGARDLAGNALDQSPRKGGKQQKAWTFTARR